MSGRRSAGQVAYLTLNGAIVAFLLAPIAVVLIFALNPTPYIAFPPVGVSQRWFVKFFGSREFMNALALSLEVAVIVVVLSTVIGALCALAIVRGNLPGARLLTTLFMSPLMLPAILTGLSLFQVFMLSGVGRPVWGLVAGHTLVAVPYVLRTTLAVLHNFDRRVEEAAAMLGAAPARVLFEVTLPLIRPGVIAGGIFAFIVSFDQLPISLFLVVPGGETLPVVLLNYIRFDLDGARYVGGEGRRLASFGRDDLDGLFRRGSIAIDAKYLCALAGKHDGGGFAIAPSRSDRTGSNHDSYFALEPVHRTLPISVPTNRDRVRARRRALSWRWRRSDDQISQTASDIVQHRTGAIPRPRRNYRAEVLGLADASAAIETSHRPAAPQVAAPCQRPNPSRAPASAPAPLGLRASLPAIRFFRPNASTPA